MAQSKYADDALKSFSLKGYDGGYNSFQNSKRDTADNEYAYGQNVENDDSFLYLQKTHGETKINTEISNGYAVKHLFVHRKSTGNELIAVAGATIKVILPSVSTLSGVTPTADLYYTTFQGDDDRTYFFNGTDDPFYYDGSTLTAISTNLPTNGCGEVAINYARRCYTVNKTDKSRIDFSGQYYPEYSAGSISNFMDFRSASYGGYFRLPRGQEITTLYESLDGLLIGTSTGEIYMCVPNGDTGISDALTHSVTLKAKGVGISSNKSVSQVANDQVFFYDKGIYSLGYQQLFGNLLRAAKLSKKVDPEFTNAVKNKVASAFFNDKLYIAYGTGSYNNKLIKLLFRDKNYQISSWSAPQTGFNISSFAIYTESNGTKHLYAASDLSTDSYVYELDNTLSLAGLGINSVFETKSTDCKTPVVKYFGFIDVPYAMVYGSLTYEVIIDETNKITDTLQLGNSSDKGAGSGSMPTGSKPSGANYDINSTFASLKQNDTFRIDCNFERGKVISVRFSNSNANEDFKIGTPVFYYQEGSIYETL